MFEVLCENVKCNKYDIIEKLRVEIGVIGCVLFLLKAHIRWGVCLRCKVSDFHILFGIFGVESALIV